MGPLHVHGQPLSEEDVDWLIQCLTADGGPDALAAATEILHGYANDRFAAHLGFDTRDAIFFVLSAADDLPPALALLRDDLGRGILAGLKI